MSAMGRKFLCRAISASSPYSEIATWVPGLMLHTTWKPSSAALHSAETIARNLFSCIRFSRRWQLA